MPDAERITLSPQISPGHTVMLPRRQLSAGKTIAIILSLKALGLILTVLLAVAAITSQTHPEIVNIRPLVEGNIRVRLPAAPAAAPMAMLPTIVSLTENALARTTLPLPTQTLLPPTQTMVVILPSPVLPSLTPTQTLSFTPTNTATITLSPTAGPTSTPTLTLTTRPSPTLTASITVTSSPTATVYPYSLTVYSGKMGTPLQGIGFGELHNIISQPYYVPDIHNDTGHHGVDLGSYDFHGKLIYNWPILSMFAGKVAGIVMNRYPIGNCIIIETPFDQVPDQVVSETGITAQQSLYTMYCHMLNGATLNIGDPVTVGEQLGLVGKSQTVEAHLHLEMVLGPQNQIIPSMAYYNADATEDEKKAYLWWRTSGTFLSFNPMNLIANLK